MKTLKTVIIELWNGSKYYAQANGPTTYSKHRYEIITRREANCFSPLRPRTVFYIFERQGKKIL